jgi:hypothetical protein
MAAARRWLASGAARQGQEGFHEAHDQVEVVVQTQFGMKPLDVGVYCVRRAFEARSDCRLLLAVKKRPDDLYFAEREAKCRAEPFPRPGAEDRGSSRSNCPWAERYALLAIPFDSFVRAHWHSLYYIMDTAAFREIFQRFSRF